MPIWWKGLQGEEKQYEGAVIGDTSIQAWPSEDVDFYAIVWNEQKGGPHEVWVGTNAHGGSGARVATDATAEIRERYQDWCRTTGCRSIEDQQRKIVLRKKEEARAEQRKLAEEKIQKQRQEAESRQQFQQERLRLTEMRKALRLCIMCGQPLSTLDRFLRRGAHSGCVSFKV